MDSVLAVALIGLGYGLVLWLIGYCVYERAFEQAMRPTPQERDQRIAELERELGINQ